MFNLKYKLILIVFLFFCAVSFSQKKVDIKNDSSIINTNKENAHDFQNKILISGKIDTLYYKNLNLSKDTTNDLWHDIVSIIGILLAGFLGWLSQSFLKKQEKNINSHNLKEVKRIQHLEQIASQINNLSLCDANNSSLILSSVNDLRNYVFKNNIYIDDKFENLVNCICDYYNEVSSNHLLKNYSKELEFSNQFKKLFAK